MYVLALSNDLVAPGTAVIVPPCLKVLPASNVKVDETVSANVAASNVLVFLTVTFDADLAASSVTVKPFSMIASSAAPGAVAPGAPPDVADQVDVDPQFPVATENLCAAEAIVLIISKQVAPAKNNPAFFMNSLLKSK